MVLKLLPFVFLNLSESHKLQRLRQLKLKDLVQHAHPRETTLTGQMVVIKKNLNLVSDWTITTNILVHSTSFCVGQTRMSHQIPFLPTVDMMMTRNSCPWNSSTEPTLTSDRPTLPSRTRIFSHWREIKKQGHYWVAKCKATSLLKSQLGNLGVSYKMTPN